MSLKTSFSPLGGGPGANSGYTQLADIIKNHPSVVTTAPDYHSIERGWHIYKITTGLGDTYCYRGAAENYIKFGKLSTTDLIWRIVRVNEDNSVRLFLYNFNSNSTYYFASTIYNSGTIRSALDGWFAGTTLPALLADDIIVDVPFYWDMDLTNETSGGQLIFAASFRTYTNDNNLNPILYDASWISKGYAWSVANGKINTPCGILTADEAVIAGAVPGTTTYNTAIRSIFGGRSAVCPRRRSANNYAGRIQWIDNSSASISDSLASSGNPYIVRPVINITGNVRVDGSGSLSDPYVMLE